MNRDKEMAHSIQSPAVDVFSLPPPFLTNSSVVPLSTSSGSFARGWSPYVFPLSEPPYPPTHTHPPLKTRLLELADRGTTVEFVKKGGGREKTSTAGLSTEWAISLSLNMNHGWEQFLDKNLQWGLTSDRHIFCGVVVNEFPYLHYHFIHPINDQFQQSATEMYW
jgi:hypothetical protein